ncbi:DNA topology modulation protein FlaR [Fictibacillus iocasae]|uniref:DNA topology modulation protein FlaR n=1 Tax=Fictibacillus iocasae TaxID=2715437 RepID=A0ABW2NRS4_9BACL
MNVSRIHIIGSVGSGKTTLAKQLSQLLHIPYYELDNVSWIRRKEGDLMRSPEKRDECLQSIIQSPSWIVEGVHYTWTRDSFHHAELILLLDTPYRTRIFRIIKRFLRQKTGFEHAHYKPTFRIFLRMFKWNHHFEKVAKPIIQEMYHPYEDKVIILKNKEDLTKIKARLFPTQQTG